MDSRLGSLVISTKKPHSRRPVAFPPPAAARLLQLELRFRRPLHRPAMLDRGFHPLLRLAAGGTQTGVVKM